MKRGFLIIFIFSWVFSSSALAMVMIPYTTLNLTVNTNGGADETFSFNSYDDYSWSGTGLPKNFSITTNQGIGSLTFSVESRDFYHLTQTAPQGWKLESVNCTSDNYSSSWGLNQNTFNFYAGSWDTVSCVLNNVFEQPKTPILIVPGVLGTDIYKGNDLLWANPKMSTGFDGFMGPLAFQTNLTPIDTSLTVGSVIKKFQINAGVVNYKAFDYTGSLIDDLIAQGYTEGKDLFTFPYDWRYGVSGKFADGSTVADQLKGQIDYILTQTDAGKAAGKVDIVAHSTGGLLVKQYVMEHPTDHNIGKAIFVAVPNLGAINAYKALLAGDNFGVFGLDPSEMKYIAQNMPVVYDLAPTEQYVQSAGSFFSLHNPFSSEVDKNFSFASTTEKFINDGLINSQAQINSNNLHTSNFDNFDLRQEGIDLYNIVGCKSATLGKFKEVINYNSPPSFDFPSVVAGDGTVPLVSADFLPTDANKTYFVPKVQHSALLSADGSRQQIISLLIGKQLETGGKVLTHSEVLNNPGLCEIKGQSINIKSPVEVNVTENNSGSFSGIASDGSVQNDIPGADYEIWGDHKYVFLPTDEGQNYTINLKGTGNGTFTLDDQSIEGGNVTQTQVFSNLPVTTESMGSVSLGASDSLALDVNGDQKTETFPPPLF